MKRLGLFIYNLFRWKRRRAASGNPAAARPAMTNKEEVESETAEGGRSSRTSDVSQNTAASGSGVRTNLLFLMHCTSPPPPTPTSFSFSASLSPPLSHYLFPPPPPPHTLSLSLSLSLSLFFSLSLPPPLPHSLSIEVEFQVQIHSPYSTH